MKKSVLAIIEEDIINISKEIIDFELWIGEKLILIFIQDLTKEGPFSKKAVEQTQSIAEKIKSFYEESGYKVEIDNDPADFRDFYFKISQTQGEKIFWKKVKEMYS
jgi:hypothetical protein